MSPTPAPSASPRKRVLAIVTCALILAVFVVGLLVHLVGRRDSSALLMEAARTELVLRDGLLHRKGDLTPFTGITIDHYANGQLKSRSSISNGLAEGLSVGYYTNGVRQVEEHFRGGVSHGLRTKWYENGNKLSAVPIVDGKLDGTFRRWHPDGMLAEEVELKEGVPDGDSRAYYPSGSLKARANLREGKVFDRQFWNDGERWEDSHVAASPLEGTED